MSTPSGAFFSSRDRASMGDLIVAASSQKDNRVGAVPLPQHLIKLGWLQDLRHAQNFHIVPRASITLACRRPSLMRTTLVCLVSTGRMVSTPSSVAFCANIVKPRFYQGRKQIVNGGSQIFAHAIAPQARDHIFSCQQGVVWPAIPRPCR